MEPLWNCTDGIKQTNSLKKPVPVSLCKPQISGALALDLTRVHAVRTRRLVARAMAHLVKGLLSKPGMYSSIFSFVLHIQSVFYFLIEAFRNIRLGM